MAVGFGVPTIGSALLFAGLAIALDGSAAAERADLSLRGRFCSTEAQIDRTVARMGRGIPPSLAVEIEYEKAVACVHVDRLRYLVREPLRLGATRSFVPTVKCRGTLVGVLVGGAPRPVAPAVPIFFVTPDTIDEAPVEERG
jgi:hypothetical protein